MPIARAALALLLLGACQATQGNNAAATDEAATNAAASGRGCGRHAATLSAQHAARPLPRLTGRVMDGANLLSPAAERRLGSVLASLETATSDQLVVITVPSLDGESIESLGLRLGNGWRIGQADIDNGVLLIVAPTERRTRIEVGCGLEGLLTDERAQEIMNTVLIPQLREREFERAVEAGADSIVAVLRSDLRRPRRWPGVTS